jgi:hypothetical protein
MLTPEEARRLGWVPYVMDLSFDDSMRFAAAVSTAKDFDDLPGWVREAAEAADRKVGVPRPRYSDHDAVSGLAAPPTALHSSPTPAPRAPNITAV